MTARGAASVHPIVPGLAALEPRELYRAATRLPASFWSLAIYFFFEYVRPQTVNPVLDILPFASLSLLFAAGTALVEANGRRSWCAPDIGISLFAAAVIASLLGAYDLAFGIATVDIFASWLLVYALMGATLNSQVRILIFLLFWCLWNLKMSLFAARTWISIGFAFRDWGVGGAPGWFQNSGEFGIEMCIAMPISLYLALGLRPFVGKKLFLALLVLPVTALMGSIASSSRGAMLGMVVIGLWMLARSRHKVRGFATLAIVGALFFSLIPDKSRERFSSSGDDATSQTRLIYWKRGMEIASRYPVLGIGYGSWPRYTQDHYPAPWQLPHNIFVECVSELGYVGLIALLILIVSSFVTNHRTRKQAKRLGNAGHLAYHLASGFDGAMIGFIVTGFFVTVLYYPFLWVNLGFVVALNRTIARDARLAASGRAEPSRATGPVHPGLGARAGHRLPSVV